MGGGGGGGGGDSFEGNIPGPSPSLNRLMAEIKFPDFPSFPGCRIVLVITFGDSTVLTSKAKLRRRD